MEAWHSIIYSAVGSSPVAALSFYWAKVAWKAREKADTDNALELAAKDVIIKSKDDQIERLQQARIEDLKAVMMLPVPTKPKPSVSGRQF